MHKKRKKKRPYAEDSHLEKTFFSAWRAAYPQAIPTREYRFMPDRKFRFDFAWPMQKIALEVQGMGPGHCSLKGMTQDYDKLFQALLLNWKVMYITSMHLSPRKRQDTIKMIAQVLSLPEKKGYIPLKYRGGSQ